MTLNGVIAFILLYFTEFDSFAGLLGYVTVVEDKIILSAEYIVLHFWPQLTHPAARSLCDS